MADFFLELPGGLKPTVPAAADGYYRPTGSNGYADVAAACAAVPVPVRIGRTVLVNGVEYAWGTDTSNAGLTVKAGGSGGGLTPEQAQQLADLRAYEAAPVQLYAQYPGDDTTYFKGFESLTEAVAFDNYQTIRLQGQDGFDLENTLGAGGANDPAQTLNRSLLQIFSNEFINVNLRCPVSIDDFAADQLRLYSITGHPLSINNGHYRGGDILGIALNVGSRLVLDGPQLRKNSGQPNYEAITGTGTVILRGATRLQDGLTIASSVTVVDERPTGSGGVFDPRAVPAAKRQAVVDADAPAVLETDEAYYGCLFYDEVNVAGSVTRYECQASAQADGSTVWKWFRSVIE